MNFFIFIIFLIYIYVLFTDNRLVIIRACHLNNDTNCSSDLHGPLAKRCFKKTLLSVGEGTTCLCKYSLCNEHQWQTLIGAKSSKDVVVASVTPFIRSTKNSAVVVRDHSENIAYTITMATISMYLILSQFIEYLI